MAQKASGSQHGARYKLARGSASAPTVNDHFKQFEEGEKALIYINPSVQEGRVHSRYHGKTAEVTGERGESYEVKVKDKNKEKTLYIKPIHLRKIEG